MNLLKKLNNCPEELLKLLKAIGEIAQELNYPVYAAGGFVRDLILGVDNFDLDIAVEGDGINFAKELSRRFQGSFVKHRRFQTATVIIDDNIIPFRERKGIKIDIATARKEIYEYPASLPKVTAGVINDDLARRDFSINAMAVDISYDKFGRLVDFFGGKEDLKNKIVRVLHNLSFIDDPTRILRAIRFEQRLNFKIEKNTLKLIKGACQASMLDKVNKHRLRDELILILKEPNVIKSISRIKGLCGFSFIDRALHIDEKTFRLLKGIEKVNSWFAKNFPHKRRIDRWLLYLAVLLENLDAHKLRAVLNDFAFRKGEIKRALSFKLDSGKIIEKLESNLSPSHIYRILEPLSYEVILLVLLKTDSQKVKNKIEDFLSLYNGSRIFIGGKELKELAVKPGPDFKKILKQLLYAKLDKKFKTKEEELSYLKDKILKKE